MNGLINSASDVVRYNGYTITKEFYSPDYGPAKKPVNTDDNRVTLDWQPNVFVNNIDPSIPLEFYNNDRTKAFKIVVEGMTVDGKMLLIEKTFRPSAKGF